MKIGLVLDHFDPLRGGVEQWTVQLSAYLHKAGHEVHVFAEDFSPEMVAKYNIVAHSLPTKRNRLLKAQAAQAKLKSVKLDVIHDMGNGWYCDLLQPHGGSWTASFERNLHLLPAAFRPAKRAAAAILPRYMEFRRLRDLQYAKAGPLVMAISKMVYRDLQRFERVPTEKLRLVYNGIDTDRFHPENRERYRRPIRKQYDIPENKLLALIITHNFRLKGVPTLLRAVGRLRKRGFPIHLLVAGGRHLNHYRWLAKIAGAGDAVTFAGTVRDTVPLYAAADVYAHPTYYDPCSLVVLEAMASGLPVITTRFSGAGELIQSGREGILLDDPGNPAPLEAYLELLQDQAIRERWGTAARLVAEQQTFERNAEQTLALYQEISGIAQRPADRIAPALTPVKLAG